MVAGWLHHPDQRQAWAATALTAVQRPFPHQLQHEIRSSGDVQAPSSLHPAFYGSYDWHSAVHNHWLLVRTLERGLPAPLAAEITAVLDDHLAPEKLAAELAYFDADPPRTSHRPYGWGWLLALHAACTTSELGRRHGWDANLAPLAASLRTRLVRYFTETLAFPIRSGVHTNSAFSLTLALDAARAVGDTNTEAELVAAARRMFDRDPTLAWSEPPSGDAFLTPPLTETDLMGAVLTPEEFTRWLDRVLPDDPDAAARAWQPPRFARDGADPGSVHLEGLVVSRTWALSSLEAALPDGHPLGRPAAHAAVEHLEAVAELDPNVGFLRNHWVPTFCWYLAERLDR